MATPPAPPGDVEATLDEYRQRTLAEVLDYMPPGEPRRWLYDLLPDYPLRPGKGLRPALCIATCRAFGGSIGAAIKSAAALELFHNAFLVHDDIQDGSPWRRGRRALHLEQGVPIALNVGDALAFLALRPLADNFTRLGPAALPILAQFSVTVSETIEGQAMELGWIRDNVLDLGVEDYLRMTLKKTAWYTAIQPCQAGAVAAWSTVDAERFVDFGFFLGAMFQIQDDLLNLFPGGDPGEELLSDLYEGKRTLMLIHLLQQGDAYTRRFLERFLARPRSERTEADAGHVVRLMVDHGSIEFARACLLEMADEAVEGFETAFGGVPDSRHSRFVRGLIPYLLLSRGAALEGRLPPSMLGRAAEDSR